MAVQKSKKTPSRRGMRRAHDALKAAALSTDPTTGTKHLRHHISPDGFYKGREYITKQAEYEDEEDEE